MVEMCESNTAVRATLSPDRDKGSKGRMADETMVIAVKHVEHLRELVEQARREADLRGAVVCAEKLNAIAAMLQVVFTPGGEG